MEVQLQELVDKIRKDGVENAEAKAAGIIKNTELKAESILNAARLEADSIIKKAEAEAARSEKAAVSAIRQAARNLILSFRDGIAAELDALVVSETSRAYDSAVLKELIPVAVKGWISGNGSDDVSVILSKSDADKLESSLISALKAEISKGLTVKSGSDLSAGFRIGARDGSSYYDFSADAVAELFSAYLNPKVADIMKSAAKEL